jgi:NADH-quinone oxidoreductase subunit C
VTDEEKKEGTNEPVNNGEEESPWDLITEQVLDYMTDAFPTLERRDDFIMDEPSLICDVSMALQVAEALLSNPYSRMNYLRCVTGIERDDCLEAAYNLMNITTGTRVCLHVRCGKDAATVPSLTPLWPGADLQEREAYDLMGITFEGHYDLRRVLLDERFINHPLRKDYPMHGKLEDALAMDAYLPEEFRRKLEEEAKAEKEGKD